MNDDEMNEVEVGAVKEAVFVDGIARFVVVVVVLVLLVDGVFATYDLDVNVGEEEEEEEIEEDENVENGTTVVLVDLLLFVVAHSLIDNNVAR